MPVPCFRHRSNLLLLWICATLSSRHRVSLALALVLLVLLIVCHLLSSMDHAFEPIEGIVIPSNISVVGSSHHGRNVERSSFTRVWLTL
jgi:hypothetical protein